MKQDLLKIINNYGVMPQLKYFQSEVFELGEAIITHELKQSVEYEIPLTEIIGTREHIAEEIADVFNLVEQFMYFYNIDIQDVIEIKHKKIHRQLERIENEQRRL